MKTLISLFDGIILGETKISIKNLTPNHYPPFFKIPGDDNDITVAISRREFNYRKYLHDYYLDGVSDIEVCEAIRNDWTSYSDGGVLVARIDLEVIPFNAPIINGERLDPPIDKFRHIQDLLKNKKINFVFLEDAAEYMQNIKTIPIRNIKHNMKEDYKWPNKELKRLVVDVRKEVKSKRQNIIWHSLLCSDYYYGNFDSWERLNCADKRKKVHIIKDRRFRDQESDIKMRMLIDNHEKVIIKNIEDNDLAKYFVNYINVINLLEKEYV